MKLLLTLTLGIASCGIGWGQEAHKFPTCSIEILNKHLALVSPQEACTFEIPFTLPQVIVGDSETKIPGCAGNGCKPSPDPWATPKPELVDVKSLKSANSCEKIKAAIASAPKLKDRAPIIDATKIPDAFNCPLSVFAVDNLDLMLKMSDGSEVFIFKLKPQTGDHQ